MNSKLRSLWAGLGIPLDYAILRRMPLQREARVLVAVGRNLDGRIIRLTPRAATAWRRMRTAAGREGLDLLPVSGFRSIARQAKIIREKLQTGKNITDILRYVAAPGCSEHHTGRALDIGSPDDPDLDERFARTAEFGWLKRHAKNFGFNLTYPRKNPHGIGYEPWHWCWRPPRRNGAG